MWRQEPLCPWCLAPVVVHLHVGRDRQPSGQEFGLLLVKGVLRFGQDPAELAGGDVDAQLVQLFPKQRLCDVLVVILMDDERDQRRSKVAVGSDVGRQFGHHVLAVGGLPAFAAITDDPGADDEILNHEVFVTFDDRSGWRVGQRDDTSSVTINWAVLCRLAEPGRF